MPKLIMLVSMAAADWSLVPGDEVDVTDEIAEVWIENGMAKLPEEAKPIKDLSSLTLAPEITSEINPLVDILNHNAEETINLITDPISKEVLESLFKLESEGKDRKTVKAHIEKLLESIEQRNEATGKGDE
jgi:hypothetical protein